MADDYSSRPDWSPIAQPPGPDGIIAHTPNPKAYARTNIGLVLPRSDQHGIQPVGAYTVRRVVDPANPYTGEGGTPLPFAALLNGSSAALHEQPVVAVPAGSAPILQNNTYSSGPAAAAAPLPSLSRQMDTALQQHTHDAKLDQTLQQLMEKVAQLSSPAVHPSPQPSPQPSPPAYPPEMVALLQEVQHLRSQMQALMDQPSPQPSPPLSPPPEPKPDPDQIYQALASVGLSFLTAERPRQGVTFDLHKGGRHKVYYHAVLRHGSIVSMIYDNRYDGNQFVPPRTPAQDPEGQPDPPIEAVLPDGETVKLLVPGLDLIIGPMDITNFIVVDE